VTPHRENGTSVTDDLEYANSFVEVTSGFVRSEGLVTICTLLS